MGFLRSVQSIFFSVKTSILLFIILSVSMAIGTFIENDFGTETALSLVYKARWFEILWLALIVNLTGGLFLYRLWRKKSVLVIHLSFFLIFVGAFLTRYAGYEGTVHLREGEKKDYMLSYDPFIRFVVNKGDRTVTYEEKFFVSSAGGNFFGKVVHINNSPVSIELIDFLPIVDVDLVEKENELPAVLLKIKEREKDFKRYPIKDGTVLKVGRVEIFFNKKPDTDRPYIHLYTEDKKLKIGSKYTFLVFDTDSGQKERKNGYVQVEKDKLYAIGGLVLAVDKFVLSGDFHVKPILKPVREDSDLSSLVFRISYGGEEKFLYLLGKGISYRGIPNRIRIKDIYVEGVWGSKEIELPFYLYLKDFVLRRYPGSDKASSYESYVILIDKKERKEIPYIIYMNNPLKYDSYRIFQTSYDKDEKGSVLSVNYDPGLIPTYTGYALLFLGLFMNLIRRMKN